MDTPTSSAFVQARSKMKVEAFQSVFDIFNRKSLKIKTLKKYRLLSIDNTIFDDETTVLGHGTYMKPYSAFHINAEYDLLECTYNDIII